MAQSVLITGAGGQLGKEISRLAAAVSGRDVRFVFTDLNEGDGVQALDIADEDAVGVFLRKEKINGMDNFMDKIAQKLNSQELIRANAAADAAELESLEKQLAIFKEQMDKYDDCIQEMRKLNLKNIESAQGVQNLADTANEKLGQTVGEVEAESVSRIKQTSEVSIAGINQALSESLAKIAEIKENSDNLEQITENMSGLQTKLEELFRNLEDFLHTDNVKVYRNVQASVVEELEKQTTELKGAVEQTASRNKVLLPFVIITMVISIANVAITVARILNLF